MRDGEIMKNSGPGLPEWLETYFDGVREGFDQGDIVQVRQIIQRLLRLEPSTRASLKEILNDSWLRDQNRTAQFHVYVR